MPTSDRLEMVECALLSARPARTAVSRFTTHSRNATRCIGSRTITLTNIGRVQIFMLNLAHYSNFAKPSLPHESHSRRDQIVARIAVRTGCEFDHEVCLPFKLARVELLPVAHKNCQCHPAVKDLRRESNRCRQPTKKPQSRLG